MTDNADGPSRGGGGPGQGPSAGAGAGAGGQARGGGGPATGGPGGDGRGGGGPAGGVPRGGGGGGGQHQQDGGFGGSGGFVQQQQQQQQQQDFSSWRSNPLAAGMTPADAAYNNFYYSGGYSPFSAGDMRDSIAAIWSRTSPSGEGVAAAFSGGYGQFADSSTGQFAANSGAAAAAAGQFAANLTTGHFATNDLSMFGAGGDYYPGHGQQYPGFGSQYHQWGENNASGAGGGGGGGGGAGGRNGGAPYSYLSGQGSGDGRGGGERGMADVQQGMEAMRLGGGNEGKKSDSNGYQQSASSGSASNAGSASQPKKMSWANVASQPAKPAAPITKTKKPGVLPPPSIIPSSNKPSATPQAPPAAPTPTPPTQVAGGNHSASPPDMQAGPGMHANDVHPPMVGGNGGIGVPPQHAQPPFSSHMPPHPQHHVPPSGPEGRPPPPSHMNARDGDRRPDGGMRHVGGHMGGDVPRPGMSNHGPRGGVATNGGGGMGGMPPSNHGERGGMRPIGSGGPIGVGGGGMVMGGGGGGGKSPMHPILDTLRSVNEYNPRNFDLNPKNARFFVIKSFSEDDIHRSIKYEIWCSTDHGNKRLDAAFKERSGKGPIYLLFSVNGSGHFCGMAQMLSGVDYNSNSGVWVQDKFKGQFKVKWIYVKDVPNGQLRHIRLENNENKPVTNSRDTQEVPPEKGKMVLKIMHSYKHQTSIFDDFVHYEKRQEEEDSKKAAMTAGGGGGGGMMQGGMGDDRGPRGGGGGRGGPRDDRGGDGDRGGDRRGNRH